MVNPASEDHDADATLALIWTIAWYILLTVVVVVGIAFFVKAFIDADDVDVRGIKA